MSDSKPDPITSTSSTSSDPSTTLHYARRGSLVADETTTTHIEGYDADRMRARTLLTVSEEKALLRRIDLRLMTLCSIMFLLKNIDADNVSNARIMNKGQPSNIMKQLGMTSNEYNLVTTMYYVSCSECVWGAGLMVVDSVYCGRGAVESAVEEVVAVEVAVEDYDYVG
jgi:hypothetical protein